MEKDLLQVYRRSAGHSLTDEEYSLLESYLENKPWFPLPHFIVAKRDASPINLLNARTYAPDIKLLKTYLDVFSLPDPKQVLRLASELQKPKNDIQSKRTCS